MQSETGLLENTEVFISRELDGRKQNEKSKEKFSATSKISPFGFWPDLSSKQSVLKILQYTKYSGISKTFVRTKSFVPNTKSSFQRGLSFIKQKRSMSLQVSAHLLAMTYFYLGADFQTSFIHISRFDSYKGKMQCRQHKTIESNKFTIIYVNYWLYFRFSRHYHRFFH